MVLPSLRKLKVFQTDTVDLTLIFRTFWTATATVGPAKVAKAAKADKVAKTKQKTPRGRTPQTNPH